MGFRRRALNNFGTVRHGRNRKDRLAFPSAPVSPLCVRSAWRWRGLSNGGRGCAEPSGMGIQAVVSRLRASAAGGPGGIRVGAAGRSGRTCCQGLGVVSSNYWSSTTNADNTTNAWNVNLNDGNVNNDNKGNTNYVWPVRGGEWRSCRPCFFAVWSLEGEPVVSRFPDSDGSPESRPPCARAGRLGIAIWRASSLPRTELCSGAGVPRAVLQCMGM